MISFFDPIDDDSETDFFDEAVSEGEDTYFSEEPEITDEGSALSTKKSKNILIFVVMIFASIFILYKIVFESSSEEQEQKRINKIIASQPEENAIGATPLNFAPSAEVGVVEIPELPELKDIPAPPPPPKIEKRNISEYDVISDFKNNFVPPNLQATIPGFNNSDINSGKKSKKKLIIEEPETIDLTQSSSPIERKDNRPTELEFDPDNIDITPDIINAQPFPGPSSNKNKIPISPINDKRSERSLEKEREKINSPMILFGSGGNSGNRNYDEVLASPYRDVPTSSATKVHTGYVGNLKNLIIQGKLIDAVLETAINTDLPGQLRAIVSRDTYAEAGKNILIPKGSRLVGSYSNSISGGQSRVIIIWERLIRPDGIDIMISSPGTDSLGKAGVAGFVDNKFFEIFTNAILVSSFTIGGTMAYEAIQGGQSTSSSETTNTDGSITTTSTGNAVDLAVLDAVQDISDVAENVAENLLPSQPTIIVQQGTRVKVFVNKDIIFPNSISGHYKMYNY